MDIKKLANIVLLLGVALLIVTLTWWGFKFLKDYSFGVALNCLYSSGEICKGQAIYDQTVGKAPYSPILFWIGAAGTVIGGLLKASLKQKPENARRES